MTLARGFVVIAMVLFVLAAFGITTIAGVGCVSLGLAIWAGSTLV